jgi:NADPH:quinone reductase-like Zn-dependent oxidoreductase
MEKEVLPNFANGTLTVPVAETFELDRAEEAYTRFESGGKLGKIVLLA